MRIVEEDEEHHAPGAGRHCVAWWYAVAVRSFHVLQPLESLTVPLRTVRAGEQEGARLSSPEEHELEHDGAGAQPAIALFGGGK